MDLWKNSGSHYKDSLLIRLLIVPTKTLINKIRKVMSNKVKEKSKLQNFSSNFCGLV